MNKSFINVAIAIAFASVASSALAQTGTAADSTSRAKRFADQEATWQSLAGTGQTFKLNQPQFGPATDPSPGLTFSELQAESSNDSMWQPQTAKPSAVATAPADPVPSGGLSIAEYQALSKEDAMWQLPVQRATTAVASSTPADGAQVAAKRPFVERLANFFRIRGGSESTVQ